MFQSFSRSFKGIVYVFVVMEPSWSNHRAAMEQPWSSCGEAMEQPSKEQPWRSQGVTMEQPKS